MLKKNQSQIATMIYSRLPNHCLNWPRLRVLHSSFWSLKKNWPRRSLREVVLDSLNSTRTTFWTLKVTSLTTSPWSVTISVLIGLPLLTKLVKRVTKGPAFKGPLLDPLWCPTKNSKKLTSKSRIRAKQWPPVMVETVRLQLPPRFS